MRRSIGILLSSLVALTLSAGVAHAHHATVPDVWADEAASFAIVHINERDYGPGTDHCIFNFAYSTRDGSATAGEDYEAVSGEGRMEDGHGSFRVPVIDHGEEEGDETVEIHVVVTDPSEYYVVGFCAGSAPAEPLDATLTIVDGGSTPGAGKPGDPPLVVGGRFDASERSPLTASERRAEGGEPAAAGGLTAPDRIDFGGLQAGAERDPVRSGERLAGSSPATGAGRGPALSIAFVLAIAAGSAVAARRMHL